MPATILVEGGALAARLHPRHPVEVLDQEDGTGTKLPSTNCLKEHTELPDDLVAAVKCADTRIMQVLQAISTGIGPSLGFVLLAAFGITLGQFFGGKGAVGVGYRPVADGWCVSEGGNCLHS
jgi:hypothetical protein